MSISRTSCGLLATAIAIVLAATPAAAQNVVPAPEARPSPMAVAQATLSDGTYVSIHYSSPRKRGREVFGDLETYGEVWRFGANEATEMSVTQDVSIGGTTVPAGTYALFAIPRPDTWTLIINENLGQWGAFSYDEDADYARIDVPSEQTDEVYEAFMVSLELSDDELAATLNAVWDQTRISIPIESIDASAP